MDTKGRTEGLIDQFVNDQIARKKDFKPVGVWVGNSPHPILIRVNETSGRIEGIQVTVLGDKGDRITF